MLVPAAVLLTLAVVAWPLALALLPFLLYAGLAPVLDARRASTGSAPRRATRSGELGAYVTETIQGLSELVAFQASARRRDGFMRAVRALSATAPARCSRDLSRRPRSSRSRPGSAAWRSRWSGAWLVAARQLDADDCCRC